MFKDYPIYGATDSLANRLSCRNLIWRKCCWPRLACLHVERTVENRRCRRRRRRSQNWATCQSISLVLCTARTFYVREQDFIDQPNWRAQRLNRLCPPNDHHHLGTTSYEKSWETRAGTDLPFLHLLPQFGGLRSGSRDWHFSLASWAESIDCLEVESCRGGSRWSRHTRKEEGESCARLSD